MQVAREPGRRRRRQWNMTNEGILDGGGMPTGTRTGPQIGSLTRKKRRQRFFSFAGKIEDTRQPDAGEPPQTTKTGEDRPHDHTLPTDPLTHTLTTESDLTSPMSAFRGCSSSPAQLKSGPAPAATASETAAGRLGHRTGRPCPLLQTRPHPPPRPRAAASTASSGSAHLQSESS